MAITATALKNKALPAAVEALGRALAIDSKLADDSQVASALWILAQSKQTTEATFELLQGLMGDARRSILHDLTTTAGVRPAIRKRPNRPSAPATRHAGRSRSVAAFRAAGFFSRQDATSAKGRQGSLISSAA
jgi:hypothetical protein